MSVIEKAVEWALGIAGDSAHGYDQTNRWGPDYDCSSFVISAYKAAGLPLMATYTGNMKYDFLRNGFFEVKDGTLKRGDVLLHEKNHTAMYIGSGQLVHASINEKGTIKGGKTGDQSGGEICVRGYYNYPWDCVLRYGDGTSNASPYEATEEDGAATMLPVLREGDVSGAVQSMQTLLIYKWAISCGPDGADADFGTNTALALEKFQSGMRLAVDRTCGPETWAAIIGGKNGT